MTHMRVACRRSRRADRRAQEYRPGTALAGEVYKAANQASAGRRAQAGGPEAARPCCVYWAEYEMHHVNARRLARAHLPEGVPWREPSRARHPSTLGGWLPGGGVPEERLPGAVANLAR